jgi:hypothetical protein
MHLAAITSIAYYCCGDDTHTPKHIQALLNANLFVYPGQWVTDDQGTVGLFAFAIQIADILLDFLDRCSKRSLPLPGYQQDSPPSLVQYPDCFWNEVHIPLYIESPE